MNFNVESTHEQCTDVVPVDSKLGRPESELLEDNILLIAQLQKEIDDYPHHACCSCERLHQRKAVTRVELSQNLGGEVWLRLKSYIVEQNPTASEQVLYMCRYCKSLITKNVLIAATLRPQWIACGTNTTRIGTFRLFEYSVISLKPKNVSSPVNHHPLGRSQSLISLKLKKALQSYHPLQRKRRGKTLSLPPSPKRPRLSTSSTLERTGLEYIGTTHQQLGDIDLPLPTDEWRLRAIEVLSMHSHRTVRNNLSTPAEVIPVRCDEIAPHIRDSVLGDGNCLFRAISKEITGTERNHCCPPCCVGVSA